MGLRSKLKGLVYGPKASSADYVAHLRSLGMVIGENTAVYSPAHCVIDATRPWLVEIGSNVSITEGVTILTHGYDWSVFKGMHGDVLGSAGHVHIGDNVFIGMNATILKGVTIGSNVIVGANSLINKDVPDGCVVVGNPQRVVCSIDDYLEKRRAVQLDEAADLYDHWRRNSPEGKRGGGGCLPRRSSASSSGCSRSAAWRASTARSTRASCACAEPTRRASRATRKPSAPSRATRSFSSGWTGIAKAYECGGEVDG
ncbi:MAG: acyltransferase [Coriobacteriia bacterium]